MPCAARGRAQRAHVLDRADVGVHGVVAALGRADGVGRAGIVRAGDERVVAALAVRPADRVDRRAGRRRRSPSRRARGSCASTPFRPPQERGKTSYQAPKRARTRSTSSASDGSSCGVAVALGVALDGGEQLVAHRGVVLGGLEDLGVVEHAERVLDQLAGRRPWRAAGRVVRAARRPRESSPASSVSPASSLRRSSSRQVAKTSVQARERELPAARLVDDERAAPADAVVVRVERAAARPRAHLRAPARPGEDDARGASRGRRGRRRRRPRRRSPTVRFAGIARRRRRRAAGTGCGSAEAAAVGISDAEYPPARSSNVGTGSGRPPATLGGRAAAPSVRRRAAPSDLAARAAASGGTRTRGSTGSPTRARRGGRCCRSARPTATARRTRRARPSPPGRGCSPSRPRRCSKSEELDFREREAGWIEDWARVRRPRRGRRPGALRARVVGAAGVRGRARRAADRRRPDLRRARLGRPARAPGAVPRRRRRGHAARRVHRARASSGATRSTTGPRCSAAATRGGSRGSRARSRSSTSRGSTTSAASSPTGRCRGRRATRSAGAGAAARAARCSRRAARRSASCR